jgi:uncharacterized membrane protein
LLIVLFFIEAQIYAFPSENWAKQGLIEALFSTKFQHLTTIFG